MAAGPGFKILGIPIKIELFFFAMIAFLGWVSQREGVFLVVWIVVAFIAVLWHELGHALAFKAFGYRSSIVLHGMGGGTTPETHERIPARRDLLISLAGPVAGFLLGFAVLALRAVWDPQPGTSQSYSSALTAAVIDRGLMDTLFVTFGWGVFNLVPILPLDGGRVMASLFNIATKGKGDRPALLVSIAVGVAGVIAALVYKQPFIALLAGLFTMTNLTSLRQGRKVEKESEERRLLTEGYEALDRRDLDATLDRANQVLNSSAGPEFKAHAVTLAMWSYMQQERFSDAARVGEQYFQTIPSANLAFQVARGQARAGQATLANEWINRSVEQGLKSVDELDAEPDLESLHSTPEFQKIRSDLVAAKEERENHAAAADNPSEKRGILVKAILAINLAIFLGQQADPQLIDMFAAIPFRIAGGEWYRLLTPMLLHADFIHIGFNSYALWIYGPNVELVFGKIRFIVLYILAGFIGGVASYTFSACNITGVGASGAIFGLLGALGAIYYNRRKTSAAGVAGLRGIMFIIGINLVIGFSVPNIANFAHMGGMAGGIVLGAGFDRFKSKSPTALIAQSVIAALVLAAGIAVALWRTANFTCP